MVSKYKYVTDNTKSSFATLNFPSPLIDWKSIMSPKRYNPKNIKQIKIWTVLVIIVTAKAASRMPKILISRNFPYKCVRSK